MRVGGTRKALAGLEAEKPDGARGLEGLSSGSEYLVMICRKTTEVRFSLEYSIPCSDLGLV